MKHLKRYAMPRMWPLPRKGRVWIVKPMPGPHGIKDCIPLQVILRDVLGLAESAAEAKKILSGGGVLVDKKVRKELKFPVGLMDIVEIPEVKQQFRVGTGRAGLYLENIDASETNRKVCKILGKRNVRKGVYQLNLHDGRNILLKDAGAYKPGDSVVIELPGQKILKHIGLEKGGRCLITAGRNMGETGRIKEIVNKKSMLEKSTVTIQVKDRTIETLKEYIMVGEFK